VRPAHPEHLQPAAEILSLVSSGAKAEEIRKGVLAVPVADDSALTESVARLAAARIGVTELSLHLPSLDEVFFTLTGRTAGDDASQATTTKKEMVA